ncbi:PREDICTED: uncharacterized protein LOC104808401 [Tarenaya hassleriana]|uniref:uncharacterized protein LOC104799775 n=1 Tax=Tarenaya hassleriana TaxID=28532 RepID=UPI00053C4B26|nr:PREDICTED: uncharacterized protein LOC104799775 [Tarenaya hassleriana]XP_010532380.1 PREDICTED: uncharacterized protein LOC104808401 [Tarenaya hassleriana]
MGNCQAVDTASVVIQHPSGKEDKFSIPVSASYVMKMNPGHYVALLISTTTLSGAGGATAPPPLRLTRIKLLRPTDTLALGQVYRLITTQDVKKGLLAKKCAKLKKQHKETAENLDVAMPSKSIELDKEIQIKKQEKQRPRISRSWQPSLQSISEGSS